MQLDLVGVLSEVAYQSRCEFPAGEIAARGFRSESLGEFPANRINRRAGHLRMGAGMNDLAVDHKASLDRR
jgi:hypothetical protein